MRLTTIVYRLTMFGITAAACIWLTRVAGGAWAALGLWALGIGAVCGGVALLMSRQTPGRITPVNYLAGIVLPWGFAIRRGKLLPIVIESWARWVLTGAAVIVATAHGAGTMTTRTLLLLSWLVLGAVVLRFITVLATRASGNPVAPGTYAPIVVMIALILGSAALTIFGHSAVTTNLALLLTAGPVVLFSGGYALFLQVVLACGRKARWN